MAATAQQTWGAAGKSPTPLVSDFASDRFVQSESIYFSQKQGVIYKLLNKS